MAVLSRMKWNQILLLCFWIGLSAASDGGDAGDTDKVTLELAKIVGHNERFPK